MRIPESVRTAVAGSAAVLVGVYPLSLVVGSNAAVLPLNAGVIVESFFVVLATVLLLLWALRAVQRDAVARAVWLSWVLFLFGLYGFGVALAQSFGANIDAGNPWFAALYALVSIFLATMANRPWLERRGNPLPLALLATVMVMTNLYWGAAAVIGANSGAGRHPADLLVKSARSLKPTPPGAPTRDIYYVVLDGFGRADVLRRYYGADLDSFVSFLRATGFYVPDRSQSNYAQTFLALASAMNMSYLDEVVAALGTGSRDRRPLRGLITHNALMRMATNAGYRVVGVGSDYLATERFEDADVCVCEQYGLDGIAISALALTPFAGLPLDRWTYGAHRRKVLESFAAVETSASQAQRTLVFAHIVAPHPPFVFGPDGSPRRPRTGVFSFADGDEYDGSPSEYVDGYRGQVQFVTERLKALVGSLLDRPGPAPVIVFHGDHGPGSMLQWEDPGSTNMTERMGIFAAYYLPDGPELYPTITPVNGMRALASRYLGIELPFLPDRTFFSTWSRPYDLRPVPPLPLLVEDRPR